MLPILRLASDGKDHSFRAAMDGVAKQLSLSEADQNELLPSGVQTRYYNRITWAVFYLAKSKLVMKPARGRFRITDRGRQLLDTNPPRIDADLLSQYPEFVEFKNKTTEPKDTTDGTIESDDDRTPDEEMESAYRRLRSALADDLKDRILGSSPGFFERLVIDLLVAMGYGGSRSDAAQVVGKSGDGGIDGTIKEDRLGLDVIYVQAKRWENPVGRKEIQSFAGSLEGERANKGVFITTSSFSVHALEYVQKIGKRIVLIDGDRLTQLMIDFGIGVSEVKRLTIMKVDGDYFEELE